VFSAIIVNLHAAKGGYLTMRNDLMFKSMHILEYIDCCIGDTATEEAVPLQTAGLKS